MIQIFYFIFNFFRYVDWRSSTRGLMDKYNFLEPPLCTPTCKNLQSKYGDLNLFFPGNMANLGCYFPKNSFVEVILAPFLFLSPSGEISPPQKKRWESDDKFLHQSVFNFLIFAEFSVTKKFPTLNHFCTLIKLQQLLGNNKVRAANVS